MYLKPAIIRHYGELYKTNDKYAFSVSENPAILERDLI
jgi:hypothetical protein